MNVSTLCPRFEKGMKFFSQRWTALIIYQLFSGPQRFCTLESSLPISGRLLSERLKELELEGIVQRTVFPETPVRIEYSLTQKGIALESIIRGIEVWSREWIELEE
ncbi:winged helix-turn-helix transcriptional regulator [Bacillus bombysepticus]|jgi:DNA-binding HxlR family transcriptional regulator|uniref:winged helix-turn-helix transcriptional regulator n=1 Tax=Bacillus cereus group TaxID=86661 RepID=UPI001F59E846|nr:MULTISPECIES: helix-turn-helix domain-containing protein [Bacillus cereus group]MED2878830.1 helix-turn-helix domain-containing protein [Bacillus thuringiensis]